MNSFRKCMCSEYIHMCYIVETAEELNSLWKDKMKGLQENV